ncbi:5-formyltetrahydrofolate cyclo-ligase [Kitasatospora sp. NPDC051853]|uniref:5-formyltetrahydrofolate cyclo-ligase n=1 Tax=Kitasatospora sp. NPDC051853 TaxID=3364058 RepID=UPI003790A08F
MHNDKAALRTRLLAERRALTPEQRARTADALAAHAGALARPGETVAAYVSVGGEPGTRPLLDALRAAGARVLLPVLLPDNDLDWAEYTGPGALAPAARGLLEPTGPRLGPDAVAGAALVLLPGLAVDRRGVRLGRGGGSYDRVLARLARLGATPVLATLLHDPELLPEVPAEPHDLPVHAAVTPSGVHWFGAAGSR